MMMVMVVDDDDGDDNGHDDGHDDNDDGYDDNEKQTKSKPWINAKIQKMMCIRDKLLRKLKRNSNHTLKDLYKQFRNRVSNYLRESKASYFYNYLHRKSNNMKNLWSGIKSVTTLDNQTIPIL